MKTHFTICLLQDENREQEISFTTSLRNANRVFNALAFALCESDYRRVLLKAGMKDPQIINASTYKRGLKDGL